MKVDIPAFSQSRVLVVGDVMLDKYWQGPSHRISPEAPVPVIKIAHDEARPGGAANVAVNIAALGGKATLVGMTGNDDAAVRLSTLLSALDIACYFDKQPELPTITKLRVMCQHQQMMRLDFEESFEECDKSKLHQTVESLIEDHDVLLISDYDKGTLSGVEELIALVKQQNKPVLVDPKGEDFNRYTGANIITPNLSEFEKIVGVCDTEADLVDRGQSLVNQLDLSALLLTRSEHGMTLLMPNHEEFHIPTKAKEVFDVTGAGDTVIAALSLAIASGAEYQQAAALSNVAAGVVVGKVGTSSVSEAELMHELHLGQKSGLGVVSQEQLKIATELAKKRGEKIIMTNGCFDILHAGHVSYLENAKTLGSRLIVAVNSDDSVTRLKGQGRPVNPLERRMAVLAGLTAVDWVVDFSDDTPANLIETILPDVLVKGGDYQIDEIAGGQAVMANGGQVKVLNFEEGISTTQIINTIRLED